MTCENVQSAIDERLPARPDSLPGDIDAHLEGCPACRAHAEAMSARLGRALAQCRALEATLPTEDLLANRQRILETIAERKHALPVRRRRPDLFNTADPLLVWGMGLAALIFVAFIGVLVWPRAPRDEQARNVAIQPEPSPAPRTPETEPESTTLATKEERVSGPACA